MTLTTPLKLHLRVFEIHGRTLRVATLRPQTRVRFTTNYFHDTWHIVGGTDGAALLGRLLWGLAFQRQPGTLVLIDGSHIVSTPFEGDPPDPILLIPDGLTSVDDDALRALKLRLRRSPGPPTTIRWHTFGMRDALARDTPWWQVHGDALRNRERMSRRAGFVCYTAPAPVLRDEGLGIYQMHTRADPWGSYHPLARSRTDVRWHYDGEFQQFAGFNDAVSAARVARREVAPDARGLLAEHDDCWEIHRHKDAAAHRLQAGRRRSR